ncbi:hypothetical protein MAM1_0310c09522 [Mucor ambiguus]|uniref:F-box domain-containing protein n=1 Tax=Mucor ambiguus TaxID=91626 RepID=A0A0C9MR87_9FUNG|nr:hypothetical protein MAM1_0310c09522 [Mucor ambiguus]
MPNASLLSLPYELVLHIGRHLEFTDIWHLGTCSHASRTLSFQLLRSLFQIDLIKPRIINPLGQSIHAAVAYLMRHGNTDSTDQQQHTVQSVANHLAIGIYDRTPTISNRSYVLNFLLNTSMAILLEHCLFDSTLHAFMKSQETHILSQQFDQIISSIRAQHEQPFEQQRYTGVLMVDFLAALHDTLVAISEDEDDVSSMYHFSLLHNLKGQLRNIRSRYQNHHSDQSSYSNQEAPRKDSPFSQDIKLHIKLICCLAQTSLISSYDLDSLACYSIHQFFLTRPSDVSFSRDSGLKICIRQHNEHLSIINTVTLDKRPAYHYQWRLWLEETQLRLGLLLDVMRAMIQKNCSQGGTAPDFAQINGMLQDTVSALTLSESIHQSEYEIPLLSD